MFLMKNFLAFVFAALAISPLAAETLRVNNTGGSGAQYTTFKDAMDAASDGDVIIVDGSPTSYGDVTINKQVTVQGPGYYLDVNGLTQTGNNSARFGTIDIAADRAKITGLETGTVNFKSSYIVVTRCLIDFLYVCPQYSYTQEHSTGCVISQNYIKYGILGDSYSADATYLEISNNIITGSESYLRNIANSTITRNTFTASVPNISVKNSVFENNAWSQAPTETSNSYTGNLTINYKLFTNYKEQTIRDVTADRDASKGAFSGDSPYVLSGIPVGAYITSVQMPESVVQGDPLEVTINVGTSR